MWLKDDVKAGAPSEPFLFSGFAKRSLHLAHQNAEQVTVRIEVDPKGNGVWTKLRDITVPANDNAWTEFPLTEVGVWVRLIANRDATKATAFLHYRGEDPRSVEPAEVFTSIAKPADTHTSGALLQTRGAKFKTLCSLASDGTIYDLDAELNLVKADAAADADYSQVAVQHRRRVRALQ